MREQRFLSVAMVAMVCVASATMTARARASETQSAEERAYTVTRARSAPIIDGVADDPAWRGVERQQLDRDMASAASWANTLDFSGEFAAVWRAGSVYVLFEFDDDSVVTDRDFVERSDRLIITIGDPFSDEQLVYTVPLFEGQSLEDPSVPFATWSYDGRVCEFSLDTDAMEGRDSRELLINFSYVDVDPAGPDQEIGWAPDSPTGSRPQYGTFRFQPAISSDGLLETSWGRMKSLY